jgi:hypothetical protein
MPACLWRTTYCCVLLMTHLCCAVLCCAVSLQLITALTAYQVDVRLLVWYMLLCWGECRQEVYRENTQQCTQTTRTIYTQECVLLWLGRRGGRGTWTCRGERQQQGAAVGVAAARGENGTDAHTGWQLRDQLNHIPPPGGSSCILQSLSPSAPDCNTVCHLPCCC